MMNADEILAKLSDFQYWDTHQRPEVETLLELAKRLPPQPTIRETGTLVGKSACSWALATGGTVYTVEYNDNLAETRSNIARLGLSDRIFLERGDSTKVPWDQMVDVVWLDSNHDHATIIKELRKYSPYARKLICGHDYNHPDYPDVRTTVDAWFDGKLDSPPNTSIWYKWVEPMVDVVSLFIGRGYCLDKFLDGLARLDYPKSRMNLIWHDTSHIAHFGMKLQAWLKEYGHLYNSCMYIQCQDPHYHFEESGDNPPKAMWQITEAYNHCRAYLKGDYMLALEDDIVAPPDGLRRLLQVVQGETKGACSLNIYRPSIERFQRQPIVWWFENKETFPGEDIERQWGARLWGEKFGTGIEHVGSGHLGFTLLDGDWLRQNKFEYSVDGIGGCDTLLGYRMMQQGFKYAIDWDLKTRHYDLDGSFV